MQERPDSFRRRRRQSIPLDGEIGWPRAERASELAYSSTHQVDFGAVFQFRDDAPRR